MSPVLVWVLHRKHGVKRHRGRVTTGIHMDQEEQFKVELFELITKLNKLREFSKCSHKETNSKAGAFVYQGLADLFEQGLSRDLYIESLLNRVELGGVFCWSQQR
ncbi:hypothetical protein YC2023_065036 [Brassica napus]